MSQRLSEAATLRRLERRLLDPAVRRDPEAVGALLADHFIEFGISGRVFDKRSVIESLRGDRRRMGPKASAFRATRLAPGVALLTYRIGRTGGRPATLRSSIWVRFGRCWKMVFHQGTPAFR